MELITAAIDEACDSQRLKGDRDEIADRLEDEDHAAVLHKDVSDVVVLMTGALEASSHVVYRDMVMHAERQISFMPVDDISATLRSVMARNMADAALDDLEDAGRRKEAIANLRFGLRVLGDQGPFHEGEDLPNVATA
ncbi:hypothetical protein CSC66_09120 [Pseudoxanthomonas kaohsiungensis]|nr:hypothetical protein CSC66_09120 [Pseudoxanthomonas kaohsiungensis]